MSPDFLLQYISIQPHVPKRIDGSTYHLPLAVNVAAVGMIPPEIKAAVEAEFADSEVMPKYLRIRRIRDLLNDARSPIEERKEQASFEIGGQTQT